MYLEDKKNSLIIRDLMVQNYLDTRQVLFYPQSFADIVQEVHKAFRILVTNGDLRVELEMVCPKGGSVGGFTEKEVAESETWDCYLCGGGEEHLFAYTLSPLTTMYYLSDQLISTLNQSLKEKQQPEKVDLKYLTRVNSVVEKSNEAFSRSGLSTTHWVAECFLPFLRQEGLELRETLSKQDQLEDLTPDIDWESEVNRLEKTISIMSVQHDFDKILISKHRSKVVELKKTIDSHLERIDEIEFKLVTLDEDQGS